MELKLGLMTNKEMAEWFGVSEINFSKHKTKFLKKLEEYAIFEPKRGGVCIKQIIVGIYVRKESKTYNSVKDNLDSVWSQDGLDTCKRVSDTLYAMRIPIKSDGKLASENTCYEYTRAARNELYGVPFGTGGTLGSCVYEWGKVDEDGHLSPLTAEEEKLRKSLVKVFFGEADEKSIQVQELIDNNQLDPEYAWDYYASLMDMKNKYRLFMDAMLENGIVLRKCTMVTRYNKEN